MKPAATSRQRIDPAKLAAAQAAAAEVPVFDVDNPSTASGDWDNAIVSQSLAELREQIALRRTRGPGKRPAKTAIQLRLPPQALALWKASGAGWQTRMAELLTARAPKAQ
ncbi:MAG: BrnA antitoxin family protein [Zoogloeaceae bacterium]|jgi:uncharacterized protein (DUF4415 family)|nr:BrnA antitoxin family protein [Zoogloeaceae bacterium]